MNSTPTIDQRKNDQLVSLLADNFHVVGRAGLIQEGRRWQQSLGAGATFREGLAAFVVQCASRGGHVAGLDHTDWYYTKFNHASLLRLSTMVDAEFDALITRRLLLLYNEYQKRSYENY